MNMYGAQFGGYGYQPMYPGFTSQMGQQGTFQPMGMPQPTPGMSAPQNAVQGGMEVVPVQTIQQVEQVQVQPGQRKMILVQNEPVVAARSADNMGLVTTEYYQLTKFDPHAMPVAPQMPEKYITEEQLEARLATFAESLKAPASRSSKKEAATE